MGEVQIIEIILEEAGKTVIGLATTAIAGWVLWLALLKHRSHTLRVLLKKPGRIFIFYYRGDEDHSHKKLLQFNEDGSINDGTHPNECYWEVAWGRLAIYTNCRKIYSKFKWDQRAGRLVHINDPKLPSAMGQYIVPLFVPAGLNREIYLQELGLQNGGH